MIHNELDYRLPISEGMAMFNVLQVRGVPSKLVVFPDENHVSHESLTHGNFADRHRVSGSPSRKIRWSGTERFSTGSTSTVALPTRRTHEPRGVGEGQRCEATSHRQSKELRMFGIVSQVGGRKKGRMNYEVKSVFDWTLHPMMSRVSEHALYTP